MALRAILFDLGDTLLDFGPMDTRAMFQEGARATYLHLRSQGHALPPFRRYARTQYWAIRWAYLLAKLTGREFNCVALLDKLAQRMDIRLDQPALLDLAWRWYTPIVAHSTVAADVIATLRQLRDWGLKLGLVSNTFIPGVIHDRHLDMVGLLPLLPVRLYSADIGHRKPDRRIFEQALALNGTSARETLFVGDLVKADIVGARRLGIRTVLRLPYANTRRHAVADFVIRRVSDLPAIVERLTVGSEVARAARP